MGFVFTSPLWLTALLPWAAVAVYLLRRTSASAVEAVPFLALWRDMPRPALARGRLRPPSLALAAALAAAGVAIVAAGGPAISHDGADRPPVILLDCGVTMPADRLILLARSAMPALYDLYDDSLVRVEAIPQQSVRIVRVDELPRLIGDVGVTAMDSRSMLRSATRGALRDSAGPVIVLSDQDLDIADPRFVQIVPEPIGQLAISNIAVRATPSPQAMVTVENQSDLRQATLTLATPQGVALAPPVAAILPPRGESRNVFVDLSDVPAAITATLAPPGDVPVEARAYVARRQRWPRVEARTTISPALSRLLPIYSRHRPPSPDSITIAIEDQGQADQASLADGPAVLLASPARVLSPDVKWTVTPGPYTQGLDWPRADVEVTLDPPPIGFAPILIANGQPVLAIDPRPPARVWVGFASTTWEQTPDFVVFWTRLLDSLSQPAVAGISGGGASPSVYALHPVERIDAAWVALAPQPAGEAVIHGGWPGLYQRGSEIHALNAAWVVADQSRPRNWQSQLQLLTKGDAGQTRPLRGYFAMLGVALLLASVLLAEGAKAAVADRYVTSWKVGSKTGGEVGRHS